MDDIKNMIESWQKITTTFDVEDKSFINLKNENIMESIIKFENQEIKEKEMQKFAFILVTVFFFLFTVFLIATGNSKLNSLNYLGFVLMFIPIIGSIFFNRTDDFPDSRLLSTSDYLKEIKENIRFRKKRHLKISIIGLSLYFPGLMLAFNNYFINNYQNLILSILIPVVIIGIIFGTIKWFKNYDKRTASLKDEITEIINELK